MRFVPALTVSLLLAMPAFAATLPVLYGGNGGHPNPDGSPLSINNGWLVQLNQNTGTATPVGHPAGVAKISGLAFEPNGDLFASTISTQACFPPPCNSAPTSNLIRINPGTGSLLADLGTIRANGVPLQIADLAVQPGTGVLFGISASSSGDFSAAGNLYTIDKNGVAHLVGATGDFFGAIAFAPNGTLYAITADLDNMDNLVNAELKTLNPANAHTLTMIPADSFYGALGIRPDGVIFVGSGDAGGLFTLNPNTGSGTLVGSTGLNFVGDLDFQPIPEPATLSLCGLALLAFVVRRRS